jgi:hypothetical protein
VTVTTAISARQENHGPDLVSSVNTPYPHYGWIPAKQLKPGDHLKTPDGQSAVVVGGSVPAVHGGWMWDLTVPGNNDHDFYVYVAANAAVLVHNQDLPCSEGLADFADANIGRTNVASEVTNGNGAVGRGVSMPRAPEDLTPQVRTAAQATGHHLGCAEIGGLCDLETQGEPISPVSAESVKVAGGTQGFPFEEHLDPLPMCRACQNLFEYLNGGG